MSYPTKAAQEMDTSPHCGKGAHPMSEDAPETGDSSTDVDTSEENTEPDYAAQVAKLEGDAKKWKSIALKHEQTAKANAEAAQKLKEHELSGKSETEKLQALLEEARTEARVNRVQSLRLQVAAEKGLPPSLAKFLPDVDNEVDMTAAAEELLEAAGTDKTVTATRQPKSSLMNPLQDEDAQSRDQLLAAMQGKSSL